MSDKAIPVNLEFCVEAMRGSMMLRGQALQVELAVGLIVFDACGSSDLSAKRVLRAVYASAGRVDCLTPGSPSYNTVNRRMDRIAKLRDKLKPRVVARWIKERTGQQVVDEIVENLAPLNLMSMDDVEEYAGGKKKHRNVSQMPEHNRRATDQEALYLVETEHMQIPIPPTATPEELIQAADRLLQLADEMKKKAA